MSIFSCGGDIQASTTADASGNYRFDVLPAGDYLIQAQAPGFDRFMTEELHFERGAAVTVDLPLQIAGLGQQVVVTALSTPQAPSELSKAVSVVDHQQIDQRDVPAISEALRPTPGLTVQQQGGPGAFSTMWLRAFAKLTPRFWSLASGCPMPPPLTQTLRGSPLALGYQKREHG